jgi:2-aminoadipate transaminase
MLAALRENLAGHARWTSPQGGMFIWATLPDYIDTTDLLARALESEKVAFVPGRSAYMDGQRGASSMRLNFAGMHEREIREGIGRIGKVVHEQIRLFGALTESPSDQPPTGGVAADAREQLPQADPGLADIVELPRREALDPAHPARRRQDR